MRQLVKNLAYYFSLPFPLNFLKQISGEQFIFPFYHVISDKNPPHVRNLYQVTPVNQFINDLCFLIKHYRPATIENVVDFIHTGKKSSNPFFFLSFDDGMRECFDVVYPILKEKGLTAAFFINPAFVDNKELFYKQKISLIIEEVRKNGFIIELAKLIGLESHSTQKLIDKISQLGYHEKSQIDKAGKIAGIDFKAYLEKEQPYMSLAQIKDLQNDDFLIGSHSYDHPKFWKISEDEKKDQLNKSFHFLDMNLNPLIRAFAFPFSDINVPDSFFRFLNEKIKLDFSFGTAGIKCDSQKNHLQRIPMDVKLKPATRIIREEYAYFVLKSLVGKNTIKRI